MKALFNNGYTNFELIAIYGGYAWVKRVNDPRPHRNDGPLTMALSDLKMGHIKISDPVVKA